MSSRGVLVFPGQGSQHTGMVAAAPEHDAMERLLDAAEALSDLDLRAIEAGGDDAALADTRVAQPLLYLADWAWGSAFLDSGLEPIAVAGHSLGELAALAIAGVFSVEAGLELVVERSRLMAGVASATPGAMSAVIGLSREDVDAVLANLESVWLANDNAPRQQVVSGTVAGIDSAADALLQAGARRVIPLKVAGAFHSPLMEPARLAFEEVLRGADFRDARIPVAQNTDPEPAVDSDLIKERLARQISSPVRWVETVRRLSESESIVMIEAGPGTVLTGLARDVDGVTAVSSESVGIEHALMEVSQ